MTNLYYFICAKRPKELYGGTFAAHAWLKVPPDTNVLLDAPWALDALELIMAEEVKL